MSVTAGFGLSLEFFLITLDSGRIYPPEVDCWK